MQYIIDHFIFTQDMVINRCILILATTTLNLDFFLKWNITIGIILLIFRYWIVEIKLKDILQQKRRHISRSLSYIFCFSMLTNFNSNIFTLIIVASFPMMIIALFWFDGSFFINLFRNWKENSKDEKENSKIFWQILERITLHIPILIFDLFFYRYQTKTFLYSLLTPINITIGVLITLILYLFFDPRWKYKEDAPRGIIILIGGILSTIGLLWLEWLLVNGYWPP